LPSKYTLARAVTQAPSIFSVVIESDAVSLGEGTA
jgi:hypothetical protein